jgi:hypothetical protein
MVMENSLEIVQPKEKDANIPETISQNRKGIDVDYKAIMELKYDTLKLLTDAAGKPVDTTNASEYTHRIAKLSNAINCDDSSWFDLENVINEPTY